ncbi:MAG TPA: hypothetical protein VK662_09790 [Acidothermaceae bacterium]|jgi:hypothetical protein|nr:hypothetical protein [Acidothermaceae bacterium]
MSGRRIAGLLAGLICAVLGMVVAAPSAFAATAPAAASAAPSSAAPSAPSSAAPGGYPAQSPLLTVSAGSVKVGSSVTVTGSGFQAGENVDLSVTYASSSNHALGASGPQAQPAALTLRHDAGRVVSAGHAIAAQNGGFTTQISLTQAGNATITATGEQSHVSLTANVAVLAPATAAAKPSTKSWLPLSHHQFLMLLPILILAIIALLVPGGLALWRRWRTPSIDPSSLV